MDLTSKNGYTFREAKKALTKLSRNSQLKVVYGTRTNKFHFILPDDMDYNTSFSISLGDFAKIKTKAFAIRTLTGAILHG